MKINLYHEDGESINLLAVFELLWVKRFLIITLTSIVGIASVIYALSIPNIYKAEAILIPTEEAPNLSSSFGALGGLASIAGINPQAEISKVDEGIAVLNSYSFFEELNKKHNFLPFLIAAKKWDKVNDSIIFDTKIYDKKNNQFLPDSNGNLPSLQLAHRTFKEVVSLKEDRRTGIVTLEVKHISPSVASTFALHILNLLNETFRQKELEISRRSSEFLQLEISKTELSEVKVALSQLIQQNTRKAMIANSTPEEFLFNVIQFPYTPEFKFRPLRAIICIVITIIGFILICASIIVRNQSKQLSQ